MTRDLINEEDSLDGPFGGFLDLGALFGLMYRPVLEGRESAVTGRGPVVVVVATGATDSE